MSTPSSSRFEDCVDGRVDATQSVVLRYRNAFRFGATDDEDARFKDWLAQTSIREGARIVPFLEYQDVLIHVLDETSLMHTRSLKSIDGCFTTARCKSLGYTRTIFETGGNTGTALTAYGTHAGIETFCFVPEDNVSLLDSRMFASPLAHLIAVDKPGRVKRAAHLFARVSDVRHIPQTSWRYEASQFRGCFILEHLLEHGSFDWLVQTISAAFGPIGIYRVLERFRGELGTPPRLLGVQQEANCPMYRAWRSGSSYVVPQTVSSTTKLLSRVMYDNAPHTYGTFEDLRKVLTDYRGDLTTVNHEEFAEFLSSELDGSGVLELLADRGIDIAAETIDKTGLIAMAATLREIRRGTIAPGSRVLCCVTSGTMNPDGRVQPDLVIRSRQPSRRAP
ncbi:MAG TPA: pyridoxal-phosphate dependent enzyme [Candidatus Krumholzibacteria bacterium]|nr:pyridoxal-phosphate dependent enzyme [Candidatus Krumholzibacteria bacterium]